MAFNDGPQPAFILNENGVRYIDPNPTDQIVNHEDLIMYVKLIARTKGRSILTQTGSETNLEIERKFVRNTTNFTYNDDKPNYLDTDWTNLGGGPQDPGEDIGTFGITNVNIEFKSSFMPKITIDFVDVRGATLFEQGPCSPYSAFLHLPYPVFELTVKGYYGKPVTYTLALVKFNTKFNSETGNFESKAEFVGYTYAFLSDIPMGYIMAVPYMYNFNGPTVLEEIWDKYRELPGLSDEIDGIPDGKMTLFDLIKAAKKLESETPKLKNSTDVADLGKLGKIKNSMLNLRSEIEDIQKLWIDKCSGKSKSCNIIKQNNKRNTPIIALKSSPSATNSLLVSQLYNGGPGGTTQGIILPYLGDGTEDGFKASRIGIKLSIVQEQYKENGTGNPPQLPFNLIEENIYGFWGKGPNTDLVKDKDVYGIDLYASMLKEVNEKLKNIEKTFNNKKEDVKEKLNEAVRRILGFNPSIRNVFAIILANTEAFLELLRRTSVSAEQHHDDNIDSILGEIGGGSPQNILSLKDTTTGGNGPQMSNQSVIDDNKTKIYPWPTYYMTQTAPKEEAGEKEKFPGENIFFSDWPEVKFVEDFIKALTEMKEDLALLEADVEGKPGFDNFAPLSVLDTPLLGNETAACRWFSVGRGGGQIQGLSDSSGWDRDEAIFGILGENAFLFGDYSFINSLSIWKSQLGFTNGWGYDFLTGGQGTTNGYTSNGLLIKPQSILENPTVLTNLNNNTNLGRYNGDGMKFQSVAGDSVMLKNCKISPTTKEGMKKAGYIDALNAMSTMYGEGDKDSLAILKAIKTRSPSIEELKKVLVTNVKKSLKKRWGGNYSEDDYAKWAIKATAALDVNNNPKVEIITQNKFYDTGEFSYVKNGKVLTLKGPIPISLNDVIHSQTENSNFLSANPYKNPSDGVKLMNDKEIEGIRPVDFNYEGEYALPEKLAAQYDSWWKSEKESKETTQKESNKKSLIYSLLATNSGDPSRPLWGDNNRTSSSTAYGSYPVVDPSNRMLTSTKHSIPLRTNNAHQLFFQSQEMMKEATWKDTLCWYDIGTPRTVYQPNGAEFADFVGITSMNQMGANDAFVQTPIWTLNYPMYKCPLLSTAENYINREEVCGWDPDSKSITKDGFSGLRADQNIYRNSATWWGINQWGVKQDPQNAQGFKGPGWNDQNWLKPLAYIFVLSLGIDLPNSSYNKLGHFPPFDGGEWNQLSSFSTFSHFGQFKIPRSYALLIGGILWRAKEGYALQWDGINPSNTDYKGWNRYNKSVGIDDLSDPVWFFHNCVSKPWQYGGAVFSNSPDSMQGGYKNDNYRRYYIGSTDGTGGVISKLDIWTTSGGDGNHKLPIAINSKQYVIGGSGMGAHIDTSDASTSNPGGNGWITVNDSNKFNSGWLKTHQKGWGISETTTNKPIRRGMFDQCRQDQVPFVFRDIKSSSSTAGTAYSKAPEWFHPKTLTFTSLASQQGRYSPMEVPSQTNSQSLGVNTQAPNRLKNAYLNLKEECKELMFIPKSLKEEFIKYFEEFALNGIASGRSGKGTGADEFETGYASWLQTMDPLNFNTTFGIGDINNDYYKIKNTQTIEGYNPGKDSVAGFYGFMGDGSGNSKIEFPDGSKQIKSYYNTAEKINNPWYATYGVDEKQAILGYAPGANTQVVATAQAHDEMHQNWENTCFVKGTKVSMVNGSYKNIENIIEGDEVLSYNTITNEFGVDTVLMLPKTLGNYQKIIAVYEDGTKNEFSPAHPFYIEGKGWASYDLTDKLIIGKIEGAPTWSSMLKEGNLHQLEVGDYCINNKGEKLKITSLDETNEYVDMYNLEHLSNNKTWFANEVLVKE